jgi:hypothetical protein
VRILKDSSYHSEEWEETDSDEDEEGDILTEESVTKEKTTSVHIYKIWWRSSAVCTCIFMIIFLYLLTVIIY